MDLGALGLAARRSPRNRAIWGAIAFVGAVTLLDIVTARGLDRTTGKFLPRRERAPPRDESGCHSPSAAGIPTLPFLKNICAYDLPSCADGSGGEARVAKDLAVSRVSRRHLSSRLCACLKRRFATISGGADGVATQEMVSTTSTRT